MSTAPPIWQNPVARAAAAAELELRRRRAAAPGAAPPGGGLAALPFRDFVERVNPSLLAYEHVPRLLDVGQRVADGALRRVMVFMPPRHLKSEVFSRLLPAYYLTRYPERMYGLVSYGASLAWELSDDARAYYLESGGALDPASTAKARWVTAAGGEMWAAGVGGPLLGRGFHCSTLDDPQDPEQALSPTYQARFRRWYPGKFYSRRQPGAAIVVVMQRLALDDAAAWLLDEERRAVAEGREPERWHVVVCDALHSSEPYGLPASCTIEPDHRADGEPLAPSLFSRAMYEHTRDVSGPHVWGAQQQQRPAALTGDFWRAEWFGGARLYDELPADAYDGGTDWDTAYTKDERNSATAYVRSFRGPGAPDACPVYVEDADWRWLETPERLAWMREAAGPHYVEQKATGKSDAQMLRRERVPVSEVPVTGGDKLARAAAVQALASTGRVFVRRALAARLLEGERQGLLRVTAERLAAGGPDLDLNDAFVQALHRHTRPRADWTGAAATGTRF